MTELPAITEPKCYKCWQMVCLPPLVAVVLVSRESKWDCQVPFEADSHNRYWFSPIVLVCVCWLLIAQVLAFLLYWWEKSWRYQCPLTWYLVYRPPQTVTDYVSILCEQLEWSWVHHFANEHLQLVSKQQYDSLLECQALDVEGVV